MTASPAATSEISSRAKAFDGFLVRKDLVRKYSRQYPVPQQSCTNCKRSRIAKSLG